jgi:site-specific DNA-methyltransferase (adenine-specific)
MTSIKFINGDCLTLMKDIAPNSIDLLLCDLPYGILKCQPSAEWLEQYKRSPTDSLGGCNWDIKIDLAKFWEEARRILRNDHSPVIHFCTTKFGSELINSNPDWFRYDLVWEKSNAVGFLCANKMPMRSHECIYIFSKKGAFYNRIDIKGDFKKNGGGRSSANYLPIAGLANPNKDNTGVRCVKSVLQFANTKGKGNHPTQKPMELYKWLIERYTPVGGTVLDPTFGSGTSCFAAQELGRHAIGFEKNKEFYDKAVAKLPAEQPRNTIDEPK